MCWCSKAWAVYQAGNTADQRACEKGNAHWKKRSSAQGSNANLHVSIRLSSATAVRPAPVRVSPNRPFCTRWIGFVHIILGALSSAASGSWQLAGSHDQRCIETGFGRCRSCIRHPGGLQGIKQHGKYPELESAHRGNNNRAKTVTGRRGSKQAKLRQRLRSGSNGA